MNAVYANVLLNMAFSRSELRSLVNEIHRVLRPGGLFVYTVWSTADPCFGRCTDIGDGLAAKDGFAGRFFDLDLIHELAERWELGGADPYEEGPEPRRLWRVTQAKPAPKS